MKFTVLGKSNNLHAYLIKFKNTVILIDFGIETESFLNHLPFSTEINRCKKRKYEKEQITIENSKIKTNTIKLDVPSFELFDISSIDIILISNHFNILGLPYITEDKRFKGKILATEPTVSIGSKLMKELFKFIQPKMEDFEIPKDIDSNLLMNYFYKWKSIYSLETIENCISKIQRVSFSEVTELFGIKFSCISSGYSLGSGNWVIESDYEKIVYISNCSTSSSRHPEPLSLKELTNADVAIITEVSDLNSTISPDTMLNDLCKNITEIITNGGDILIPCYPVGLIYDLIEYLRNYLNSINLASTNLYFISPISNYSVQYSNIIPEWVCDIKKNKSYEANEPFTHSQMIKNGSLHIFSGANSKFAQVYNSNKSNPSIIFCGHPSLRFGDVIHIIKMLDQNPKNGMILIEPDYITKEVISCFPNLKMKIGYCPIDLRLNQNELSHLINEIKPKNILIPNTTQFDQKEFTSKLNIHSYGHLSDIKIPMNKKLMKAFVQNDLAKDLYPIEINMNGNISQISMVHSTFDLKDGKLVLNGSKDISENTLFGQTSIKNIIRSIESKGIRDFQVEKVKLNHYKITLDKGSIILQENKTIISINDNETRRIIKEALLENYYIL